MYKIKQDATNALSIRDCNGTICEILSDEDELVQWDWDRAHLIVNALNGAERDRAELTHLHALLPPELLRRAAAKLPDIEGYITTPGYPDPDAAVLKAAAKEMER